MATSSTGQEPQRLRRLSQTVDIDITTVDPPHLDLVAHRRWDAANSVKFLRTIDSIDIHDTCQKEGATFYMMEVYTKSENPEEKPRSFGVARRYSEFDKLRESVSEGLVCHPQCACEYCTAFLLYIRFCPNQPSGVAKLAFNVEKRKLLLTRFINDFVRLGLHQVPDDARSRKCRGRYVVPGLLETFLRE